MSNLIRYIIQEDPEKQMKKNDLDYTKYPTSWAPIQKQSQEDKYKGYKFSSKNLLENSFNSLTSNKSAQSKDEGSFMGGISNIFNNIKSDEKSSSNTSLPQSIAKTATEESSKIGNILSPKPIGNDNASYKIAQNNKPNIANDVNISSIKKNTDEELIERMTPVLYQMEEPKNHIYIDTTWNKTSGIGANVNDWDTFKNINWQINGRAATEEEKRAAFDIYQKDIDIGLKNKDAKGNVIKNNRKADAYKSYSQLALNDEEINKLLKQHLQDDIKYLQKEFPDFASYPPELQNVLLDIKFNTGNVSQENWPKLRKAIAEKNLFGDEGIIDNVHRKDVGEDRNLWAEQQIRNIKSW